MVGIMYEDGRRSFLTPTPFITQQNASFRAAGGNEKVGVEEETLLSVHAFIFRS